MATQTEKFLKALLARGFTKVETRSAKACYQGKDVTGKALYVWPDKTGGGRYSCEPKIGTAIPLSSVTIERLLSGQPSNLISMVASQTPT